MTKVEPPKDEVEEIMLMIPVRRGDDVAEMKHAQIRDRILKYVKLQQEALLAKLEAELPEPKQVDFLSHNLINSSDENKCKFYRYGGYDFALNEVKTRINKLRLEL